MNECYYTPDNPPPKINRWALYLILLLIAFWIFVFTSCSPYPKLQTHPPITTKDSNQLSFACIRTFPPQDKPEYDIGNIDTIPDSTYYYKQQYLYWLNQKQKTRDSIINVHDTVDTGNIIGGYDEGYYYGYKVGTFNGLSQCKPSTKQVDTIRTRTSADNALISNLQSNNTLNNIAIEKLTTQLSDTKSDKDRYFWYFVIACICAGVSTTWAVKKTFFA